MTTNTPQEELREQVLGAIIIDLPVSFKVDNVMALIEAEASRRELALLDELSEYSTDNSTTILMDDGEYEAVDCDKIDAFIQAKRNAITKEDV